MSHETVARSMGAEQSSRVLLTPSCTGALTVAIQDLLCRPDQTLLTTQWEHHAVHRPLLKRAEQGDELEYIPATDSHGIDLEWLADRLAKGDVAAIVMTAACNVTGDLLDYSTALSLARQHGTVSVLDAAQIAGWIEPTEPGWGADLAAIGAHKGMQGPLGIGALYLKPGVQLGTPIAACSIADADSCEARPDYCDVGSVNQPALAGWAVALNHQATSSIPRRLDAAREQVAAIEEVARNISGIEVLRLREIQDRVPTLALLFGDENSSRIAANWREKGVVVGHGLQCNPLAHATLGTGDTGLIRISVGPGTTASEVDRMIELLQQTDP